MSDKKIIEFVIQDLNNGIIPWRKKENAFYIFRPQNIKTNNYYNGYNNYRLREKGGGRIWGTFKQWSEFGGKIKKGSKGTNIIFFQEIERAKKRQRNDNDNYCDLVIRSSVVFPDSHIDLDEKGSEKLKSVHKKLSIIPNIEKYPKQKIFELQQEAIHSFISNPKHSLKNKKSICKEIHKYVNERTKNENSLRADILEVTLCKNLRLPILSSRKSPLEWKNIINSNPSIYRKAISFAMQETYRALNNSSSIYKNRLLVLILCMYRYSSYIFPPEIIQIIIEKSQFYPFMEI